MDMNALYNEWLEKAVIDPDLKEELESIKGNEEEILDRFYRCLEFGTAGLRGVIGAGTNRMNYYTVCQATQGLAVSSISILKILPLQSAMIHVSNQTIFQLRLQRYWLPTALRFIFTGNYSQPLAFPLL